MHRKQSLHNAKVCIVGLGPAGIGAALILTRSSFASRVLCLDAGEAASIRSCSLLQGSGCKKEKPCQMISGFGGCSLLAGGKVSTFPAGSKLGDILGSKELAQRTLLTALTLLNDYLPLEKPSITPHDVKEARKFFRKLGFAYKYYDAYLFEQQELRKAYQRISLQLESMNTSTLLNTEVIEIHPEEDHFELTAIQDDQKMTIFAEYLLLGVGRLGRSLLKSLNTKLNLNGKQNHLDVGVRLEFPADLCPEITRYHNDLKLLFDDARTFCVCNQGKVAPYRLGDVFFTDGYRDTSEKSSFTNLGILLRLQASEHNETILNRIESRLLEISDGRPLCQRLPEYLHIGMQHSSSEYSHAAASLGVPGDIHQCFPPPLSTKIREAVFYFASRLLPQHHWYEVNVFAPEVDYGGLSFPVNPDFSIVPRMYLIGDCTGRFRGILQAFASGIICGESIVGGKHGETSQ